MSEKFDIEQGSTCQFLDRFLSRKCVLELIGVSAVTLWREVKAGRFPAPVDVSLQRKCWSENEIRLWQAARLAERRSRLH